MGDVVTPIGTASDWANAVHVDGLGVFLKLTPPNFAASISKGGLDFAPSSEALPGRRNTPCASCGCAFEVVVKGERKNAFEAARRGRATPLIGRQSRSIRGTSRRRWCVVIIARARRTPSPCGPRVATGGRISKREGREERQMRLRGRMRASCVRVRPRACDVSARAQGGVSGRDGSSANGRPVLSVFLGSRRAPSREMSVEALRVVPPHGQLLPHLL